jgi:hypothetical protein
MGWKDFDDFFNHVVGKFRDRFKCACGISSNAILPRSVDTCLIYKSE